MRTIEQELCHACTGIPTVTPKPEQLQGAGEPGSKERGRRMLVLRCNSLTDRGWDKLSAPAQQWLNQAVKAIAAKQMTPEFPDEQPQALHSGVDGQGNVKPACEPSHLDTILNIMRKVEWEDGNVNGQPPADYQVIKKPDGMTRLRIGKMLNLYFDEKGMLMIHATFDELTEPERCPLLSQKVNP
jgi:hypothetical protein